MKKNAKRGFYRKKMFKQWRTKTYHRREMSESVFGATKQKYGSSVNSRLIGTQKADIYCRAILHNLSLVMQPEIFNIARYNDKFKRASKHLKL